MKNALANDATAQRSCAEKFFKEYPQAWEYIEKQALQAVAKCRRFSVHDLLSAMRWEMTLNYEGKTFKVNRNIGAATARLLCERHPECKRFIDMRKSACDWAFEGAAQNE